MPTSPEHPAAGDLAPLLNQAVLRLGSEVKAVPLSSSRVAVKYQTGRRYLVLTPQQWALLQEFGAGRTVPQVLCAVLPSLRDTSLREFYELVVKAARAGVLQGDAMPLPPAEPPAKWPLRLNGTAMRWTSAVLALAAGASLVLYPLRWPENPAWLLAGWALGCVAASLGWVFAAGVVKAAGAEVYRPRFALGTVAPRFTADGDDALMAGRRVQANAALARLLPLFLCTALVAWRLPDALLPVVIALLVQLSPLWPSAHRDLLRALYRDLPLATAGDQVFVPAGWLARWRQVRAQLPERKFLLVTLAATVGWALLVFLTVCGLLRASMLDLLQRFNAADGWRYTALVVGAFAVLLVLAALVVGVWVMFRQARAWARERAERNLRPAAVLVSPETIAAWLGRTALFRDLAAADLAALAAAVQPEEHKRGSFVVREGEAGERLYVVLSGRVEVRRDYAPGRSEPVAELGEGEVFGEIALLQGGVRTRSIRALEKSILLGLAKADFERLVLSRLSRAAVEEAVQKIGFLAHLELTRNWSQAALAAFARRSRLQEYAEGAAIMQEGANNHWFFLVHRGELAVTQQKTELRRLKLGDSFGEMSLLGDGVATATVTVRSKAASCLVISGRDFLEFVTQDFAIGLGWEENRLRPVQR